MIEIIEEVGKIQQYSTRATWKCETLNSSVAFNNAFEL